MGLSTRPEARGALLQSERTSDHRSNCTDSICHSLPDPRYCLPHPIVNALHCGREDHIVNFFRLIRLRVGAGLYIAGGCRYTNADWPETVTALHYKGHGVGENQDTVHDVGIAGKSTCVDPDAG